MADLTQPTAAAPATTGRQHRRAPLPQRLAGWFRALFRRSSLDDSLRESLEDVFEERAEAGKALASEERHMLVNLLSFGELKVEDVMVPRADIVALDETASLEDALRMFRDSNHSRLPVYRETLDDPLGMVHIKDLMRWLAPREADQPMEPFALRRLRRDVLFVPPSMPAHDLLLKMQTTRSHLALVIDEYGGTDGLVSIEDLVEEIVGDIEDEHDVVEGPLLVERDDGKIDADARAPIEELERMLGFELVDEEEGEDVDTLGGLVFSLVGRVPLRGEVIAHPAGLEFEVRDADPRRIKRLRVHHAMPQTDAAQTTDRQED